MYVCLHSCLCSVWEYTLLLLGLVLLMYSLFCGSFRKLSHGPSARNRGLIRASDFCLYSCPQKFVIYICLHVWGQCSSAQMLSQSGSKAFLLWHLGLLLIRHLILCQSCCFISFHLLLFCNFEALPQNAPFRMIKS